MLQKGVEHKKRRRQGLLTVGKGRKRKMCVLQRLERRGRRHEAAQNYRPGHADALVEQIKLGDRVLAQRNNWNAAKISQRCVLEDDLGQTLGAITGDVVEPDTVQKGSQMQTSRAADTLEKGVRRCT